MKKIWIFLWKNIFRIAGAISINFDMWRKYTNLVEIGLIVLDIWMAKYCAFTLLVNNTLVCHVSFVFLAIITHHHVYWLEFLKCNMRMPTHITHAHTYTHMHTHYTHYTHTHMHAHVHTHRVELCIHSLHCQEELQRFLCSKAVI